MGVKMYLAMAIYAKEQGCQEAADYIDFISGQEQAHDQKLRQLFEKFGK